MTRGTAVLGLVVSLSACARHGVQTGKPPLTPPPVGSSTVVLERVIDADSLGGGGRKLLRRLTGENPGTGLLGRPYGVAWDDGDLLVTDPANGKLVRLRSRGRASATAGGAFESPIGVGVCGGRIVVTDSRAGRVALVDRALREVSWIAEGLSRPTGVACDENRILIVETGLHRVVVFERDVTEDGADRWRAAGESWGGRGDGPGEFNFPAAISRHGSSIWIGDTLNFRVQRLDAVGGGFVDAFGRLGDAPGEMPRIKGLAVDAAGHLWVSDAHLDLVSIYRPDGTFLTHLGGTGSSPGMFSHPAGVAAHPDGRVAVVDSLNRRVQIFRVAVSRAEGG